MILKTVLFVEKGDIRADRLSLFDQIFKVKLWA
jgi:hypothetical protein